MSQGPFPLRLQFGSCEPDGSTPTSTSTEAITQQGSMPKAQALHPEEFERLFLALAQVRGVGVQALRALLERFGDVGNVWKANSREIAEVLADAKVPGTVGITTALKVERAVLFEEADRLRQRLRQDHIRVLSNQDPAFPPQLREVSDAPYWLFVQGDPAALSGAALVAIVGTREASEVGQQTARQLTREIAGRGLGLVSGLAEGIDQAAHRMAWRLGVVQVAVLGTGIDVVFPASTGRLRQGILDMGGAVVTEYLPGQRWGKSNFVQRDRIQAALAVAVCPVEGRMQGGTAHTVRFAEKYERPVFGAWRGSALPANELFHHLVTNRQPVFDLSVPRQREALRAFLDALPGKRGPVPDAPSPEFLFKTVEREVQKLLSHYDLTHDQKRDLIRRVEGWLGTPDPASEDAGGR
jgi:DNA protecting protein DprA